MVSKCANPACSTLFQYFREGKLFRVEAGRNPAIGEAGPQVVGDTKANHVEHYWLCGTCSASLTLGYDSVKGVVAVPLYARFLRRAVAS